MGKPKHLKDTGVPAALRQESDDQDEDQTDGVLFWTNKSGFPIVEHVWERMFNHATKLHPAGDSVVAKIRQAEPLISVTIPKPPGPSTVNLMADQRVSLVQKYMCDLQYNHTGTQFFDIKKYRNLNGLNETAREMIRESLPIKCLEAVILGIHLTNGSPGLERFTIGFRSAFGSNVHRHVVLGLHWNGLYGALGMSRRDDLMYKSLEFTSLADLVIDYIESYHQYWHKVTKIKIGFSISHDPMSHEPIHWKGFSANPSKMSSVELRLALDKYSKDMKSWVRQAPYSSVYVPKIPALPTPTASVGQPSKRHKSLVEDAKGSDGTSAMFRSSTALDRPASKISRNKLTTSLKNNSSPKSEPNYEMRI